MIEIERGPEPAYLRKVRLTELRFKCCYCEAKIAHPYNDVEHVRPKARADRRPGSVATHGYWWLPDLQPIAQAGSVPAGAGEHRAFASATAPGKRAPAAHRSGRTEWH